VLAPFCRGAKDAKEKDASPKESWIYFVNLPSWKIAAFTSSWKIAWKIYFDEGMLLLPASFGRRQESWRKFATKEIFQAIFPVGEGCFS